MSSAQPPAKTNEVFTYLQMCANEMRTVTYGEVAQAVGLVAAGMGRPLGYIRDQVCRARGLPWLNAIAVNTDDRRPGKSFLPDEVSLSNDDQERMWRGMVLQVFAYDWSTVNFS